MVFEDLDSFFGNVPSVVVGWDQLELHLVGFYGIFLSPAIFRCPKCAFLARVCCRVVCQPVIGMLPPFPRWFCCSSLIPKSHLSSFHAKPSHIVYLCTTLQGIFLSDPCTFFCPFRLGGCRLRGNTLMSGSLLPTQRLSPPPLLPTFLWISNSFLFFGHVLSWSPSILGNASAPPPPSAPLMSGSGHWRWPSPRCVVWGTLRLCGSSE